MIDKNERNKIGMLLAEWNPIGVPEELAYSEYEGYIGRVINSSTSKEDVFNFLESLLIDTFGLDYKSSDEIQRKYLTELASNIFDVIKA